MNFPSRRIAGNGNDVFEALEAKVGGVTLSRKDTYDTGFELMGTGTHYGVELRLLGDKDVMTFNMSTGGDSIKVLTGHAHFSSYERARQSEILEGLKGQRVTVYRLNSQVVGVELVQK